MRKESVIGIVFSKDRSSVLLVKRRDVPVFVLPGGGAEDNENLEEAIIREIFEETGFTVKVKRLVGIYQPKNKLTRLTHLFECTIVGGAATITNETSEVSFFPLKRLPKMIPPPFFSWIFEAEKNLPLIERSLSEVNYKTLCLYFLTHPILVLRFLLSRIGIYINSKS